MDHSDWLEFLKTNDTAHGGDCLTPAECEALVCSHEWPSGVPSTKINLATMWLECAQCGENLMDLNPWVCRSLREPRRVA